MTRETLAHIQLGFLHGVARGDDIVQFRGIPYADITARFRQSVLRSQLPGQPFDARQPGPICPQTTLLPFPEVWKGALPPNGIQLDKPRADEFGCLVLNITAPRVVLTGTEKVPVLVYIHGGGFVVGSSGVQVAGREITDATNLVRKSLQMSKPIIVVAINYRVGPLGFLASKELVAYNKKHGEAVGNYGLHDQRIALEWVSKFIGGFGGDPGQVTIEGGSAGAVSCHIQSMFPNRKFSKAILASGTCIAMAAMPLDWHQTPFDVLNHKFPGDGDVIERLQAVPADTLTKNVVGIFYVPLVDGEWIPGRTITALKHVHNPPDLMIGSCAFEQDLTLTLFGASHGPGMNEDQHIKSTIQSMVSTMGLTTQLESVLSPTILQQYGLQHTVDAPSQQLSTWAEFVADLMFRIPPFHIALNHESSKVYIYDFQATNPFPGWQPGYGKANHAISDIFLFDPAGDLVEKKHQTEYNGAVQQLQVHWINFCYGELDWEAFERREKDRLGPVYSFENHGNGRKYDSLCGVIGEHTLNKWKAVLAVSEG